MDRVDRDRDRDPAEFSARALSEVVPGLFVTNHATALELGPGMDLVVNCTPALAFPPSRDGQGPRPELLRIPVEDDPWECARLVRLLGETRALDRIDSTIERGGRVLVHCAAGAQRSPAVAACYLVARRGMAPDAALGLVRRRRPVAFATGANFLRAVHAIGGCAPRRRGAVCDAPSSRAPV